MALGSRNTPAAARGESAAAATLAVELGKVELPAWLAQSLAARALVARRKEDRWGQPEFAQSENEVAACAVEVSPQAGQGQAGNNMSMMMTVVFIHSTLELKYPSDLLTLAAKIITKSLITCLLLKFLRIEA